jgi:hypothetical protein
MSNPSKAQGTGYENRILVRLRDVYGPDTDRAKAGSRAKDFVGTRWPCEAKKRKVVNWRIPTWAKDLREVHGRNWVLFVGPKDLRKKAEPPELMIVPLELGLSLLEAYERDSQL